MTVRAKMRAYVTKFQNGDAQVSMNAVYSNDPLSENKAFSDATPNGTVTLVIANGKAAASFFESGAEYYVDFTKAS